MSVMKLSSRNMIATSRPDREANPLRFDCFLLIAVLTCANVQTSPTETVNDYRFLTDV